MAKIPVIWYALNPEALARGQWDDTFLNDLMSGEEFDHKETTNLSKLDFAIVIIHARLHDTEIKQINKDINKLKSCIVMLVGDEANVFPFESLRHPNIKTYVMHPRPGRHDTADRFLINSYAPDTKLIVNHKEEYIKKPLDWFFAGQLGHRRREECIKNLKDVPNGEVFTTKGFTQGMPHNAYFRKLASAKFAPCPSGPETPDTFRLYEALEAGCIPIVDSKPSREGYPAGFWENLFGEVPPFPILETWDSFKGCIDELLPDWESKANEVFAWWQGKKRQYAYDLYTDVFELTGIPVGKRDVTAMIPVSPSPVHPSTDMINEVMDSVTERIPNVEFIIQLDGVRQEQENRKEQYKEHVRRMLWECNWDHQDALPVLFNEHMHQSGKAKATIDLVKTPYLLYMEHDTPLFDEIPFDKLISEDLGGLNLIRFKHEATVLDPHKHLMLDQEPITLRGIAVIRTVMWSQRPHLARTSFYRWILSEYFGKESKTMIEWVMYGVQLYAWQTEGYFGWLKFQTAIYAAKGKDGIRRSANIDGRKDDPILSGDFAYDGDTPKGAPEPGTKSI